MTDFQNCNLESRILYRPVTYWGQEESCWNSCNLGTAYVSLRSGK